MSALGGSSESRPGDEVMGELLPVLQRVHLPCWIFDDDGNFVWLNDAFVEMFGDLTGEHFSAIVAPERWEAASRHVAGMYGDDPVSDYETEFVLPDGRRVATEVSSVHLEGIGLCCGAFGLAGTATPGRPPAETELTPRQLEILVLLSGGASTAQIAKELFISKTTVRNHIAHLLATLGVHSRLAAVAKARRDGLIQD